MKDERSSIVTILTDFGDEDWFVASMEGVIAALAPRARTIGITQRIPPGDIRRGALVLRCSYRCFPPGTVHLAVVDPGVGTDRAALAARAGGHLFVAPDNGLLSWILREEAGAAAFRANRRELFLPDLSTTFHGRDIFAPLAARLAQGLKPEETGPPLADPVLLSPPHLRPLGENRWEAEIIGRDRFGNLLTSLTRGSSPSAANRLVLKAGGRTLRLRLVESYCAVSPGELLAVWGSCGFLELSVNGGSAAERLGLNNGERVEVGL